MNLYELPLGEENAIYKQVAASNTRRHYSFLLWMIHSALQSEKPWLSESLIKALNFHAIAGLHSAAGQYRDGYVEVKKGEQVVFKPPDFHRVPGLMEDFVNSINWHWQNTQSIVVAAYALWRLNFIHPFTNGNGRTARAICYFILCVSGRGLLPGNTILPEIMAQSKRPQYYKALQAADGGDLSLLIELISECLREQQASVRGLEAPS